MKTVSVISGPTGVVIGAKSDISLFMPNIIMKSATVANNNM